jgi:hypothetical protein
MDTRQLIARQLRQFYTGKNWTWVWFSDVMEGVDWKMATYKHELFNSIATLVYHINYYVRAQIHVLKTGTLDASDKDSFNLPPIRSEEDWKNLLQQSYADAEELATLIEAIPEEKLLETFIDEKYGNFYRNFQGNIEHMHYHLGQIVLLKKLIPEQVR